jgi:hypothetical protein
MISMVFHLFKLWRWFIKPRGKKQGAGKGKDPRASAEFPEPETKNQGKGYLYAELFPLKLADFPQEAMTSGGAWGCLKENLGGKAGIYSWKPLNLSLNSSRLKLYSCVP